MFNPCRLEQSRHGVYYFRFPIPIDLHPERKQRSLRLSLATRCPQEALQLSNVLGYAASLLLRQVWVQAMDYDAIRAVLKEHFTNLLERKKQLLATEGRLHETDAAAIRNSYELNVEALKEHDYSIVGTDEAVHRFASHYELPLSEGSKGFETLRVELLKAHRDYCSAVLECDAGLEHYDFSNLPTAPVKPKKHLLGEKLEEYFKEKLRLREWRERSLITNKSYFDVLTRYLGENAPLAISDDVALDVKNMLIKLPKNAGKIAGLKGLAIDELVKVEGYERLSAVSVSKYIRTYSSFYAWAVKCKLVDTNPFADLVDNVKNVALQREPFSDEDVQRILDKVIAVKKPHHKWGTLIAFYTGARLNEIASLHKKDIKQVEGIWCIDINEDGENKRLKNAPSKRVLPIHPHLVKLGFLKYVAQQSEGRIFKQLEHHPKDGYGRAIGRWFNDSLLRKQLGITSPSLVFHSARHTVAQKLRNKGVEEATLKDVLGHGQIGVAMAVYARKLEMKVMLKALEKLDYGLVEAHTAAS